jgi:hypothetical protein
MTREVVIDANLTVLLFVGATDRSYIRKHKRLDTYDETDFDILCAEIDKFAKIVFTPNMLTEASNIMRQIADPIRSRICATMARFVGQVEERVVGSRQAVLRKEYIRLGLSDCVLLDVLQSESTLLTADFDLYFAATSLGLPAINYRHIQEQRPDLRP